ncbi:transposase [Rhizobium sp. F40D2]|uniref:transposase n=1 Tax=Rhizobium sp. F40D2 TaxID=3453141 RepID=UPI003F24AD10
MAVALEVFRASLPRRGDKGRDDRLLEAIHYFSIHNISWRALPDRFGKWNSVWKRFERLSKAGVFETFFEHLAALSSSAHLIQMFDSTVLRAHVLAAGAKGAERTGARPFARRLLHQNSPQDRLRRPSDRLRPDRRRKRIRTSLRHPARARPRCRSAGGRPDKGYASKANRQAALARGIVPIIPRKANGKGRLGFFAKAIYKGRARVEQAVGKLKQACRPTMREDEA